MPPDASREIYTMYIESTSKFDLGSLVGRQQSDVILTSKFLQLMHAHVHTSVSCSSICELVTRCSLLMSPLQWSALWTSVQQHITHSPTTQYGPPECTNAKRLQLGDLPSYTQQKKHSRMLYIYSKFFLGYFCTQLASCPSPSYPRHPAPLSTFCWRLLHTIAEFFFPCHLKRHFHWPQYIKQTSISPPGRSHCWWIGTTSKPSRRSVRPYSTRHRRSRTLYECPVPHCYSYFGLFVLQCYLFGRTRLVNTRNPPIL